MSSYISKQVDEYIKSNNINFESLSKKDKKLNFIFENIKKDYLSYEDLSEANKFKVENFLNTNTNFAKKNYKISLLTLCIIQIIVLILLIIIAAYLKPIFIDKEILTKKVFSIYIIITLVFCVLYCIIYDVLIRYKQLNKNFNRSQTLILNTAITVTLGLYLFFSIIIVDCYFNKIDDYYNIITLVSLIIVIFFQWSVPEIVKYILTSKENNNSSKNIELSEKVQETYILLNWASTSIFGFIVLLTFVFNYFN
ncbi:hypothetical protein [Staphylococcus warneri]|nr:hypothetical protein [Staphylococcus warneri]